MPGWRHGRLHFQALLAQRASRGSASLDSSGSLSVDLSRAEGAV